ncbi:formamidopyrimidine-DNA glycosylase isoform X4 [Selaginella moellendorffii]|uniref:formamidopyrimidine-DNA glycosylase isoform X4 n=1 Tax=Selaginella moellendorffii TaxID=88036 RepID=UPI000D1C3CBE|nr:formamidopyrimidine-DNA glycosylase isoform X4 [Selaginella moellendorffii]|eukprot:XP_024540706.1 formamidopyrimidine-DNA glycosylase isoform X4 [Selaginella moellendorffii]
MPELPEVEAARRAVELHCKGLICRASVADDTTVIEGMAPFDMQRRLVAKRIVAAHRKGKQLWLELDEPPSICFQFGMAGAVYVKGVKSTKYVRSAVKDEDEWPSKYSKVHLVLDTGVEMSFTDKRRFARVRLLQDPRLSPPISELGPDAYTELPDETTFADSVAKKKTAIKAVLLDQSFIAGIGNWIADEVLYQSRIHPEQPASTLTAIDCERLRGAIKEVLETAIAVEGDSSQYPDDWIYQHREKKSGATVNGLHSHACISEKDRVHHCWRKDVCLCAGAAEVRWGSKEEDAIEEEIYQGESGRRERSGRRGGSRAKEEGCLPEEKTRGRRRGI